MQGKTGNTFCLFNTITAMIIYFDTETTGLYPGQICQLSYVMQSKHGTSSRNLFFTVDYVEYGALQVHGFSVEKLKSLSGGKRFSDFSEEIARDFASADLIISHNTAFDFSFMRAEFERLGQVFYTNESFCSMKNMTAVCKLPRKSGVGYKYPKLSELCKYLDISDSEIKLTAKKLFGESADYHDARFDTTAVYLAVNAGMKKECVMQRLEEYL